MSIEDKMQAFLIGILDLDEPGPEVLYYVMPDRSVTTFVRFPDGTRARGDDTSGNLLALLGELPAGGWYSASGQPVSAPLGA